MVVTFDESHKYGNPNRVVDILLGDAVLTELVGTSDNVSHNRDCNSVSQPKSIQSGSLGLRASS